MNRPPETWAVLFFADLKKMSTEGLREMVRQEVEMLKELEVKETRADLQDPHSMGS